MTEFELGYKYDDERNNNNENIISKYLFKLPINLWQS